MQSLARYGEESDTSPTHSPEAGPSRLRGSQPAAPITRRTPAPEPKNEFEGMSEQEIFRAVTAPPELEGLKDWGIPPEVDPEQASDALKAKVSQFLKLKSKGQHINDSLLKSTSFANPHIYSKLVEFVDIDERASACAWLTRDGLEDEIPLHGPKALMVQQNAMAEAVRQSQTAGKRKEIPFTSTRDRERERERERERDRDRDERRREDRGGLHRSRHGWDSGNKRRR